MMVRVLVMGRLKRSGPRADDNTARTIRFPTRLRAQIAADAERCGRSFEAQVLAILRHHYGESVGIAPPPALVLALARGSLEGIPDTGRARSRSS
jgi:hypothetical protein